MAESEEKLKSFLMRVEKDSEKAGLKLNIKKLKIMTSVPITSWEIPGWVKHKLEIKIAGRNINNLRYADDTALMAESDESERGE